jgi:arylsulfatase A-like enzyme
MIGRVLIFLSFIPLLGRAAPDILLILADQWSPRYVSWDDPQVKTPVMDQLAEEGAIFDACYVTSPICMPSRVSLLTGLYPHNHGHALWGNAANYYPDPEDATMYRDLQAAGYTTAHVGKTHWTSGAAWRERFGSHDAYYTELGLDAVVDVPGPPDSAEGRSPYGRYLTARGLAELLSQDIRRRYILGESDPRPSVVKVEDYHDLFVAREAVKQVLAQPKDQPLCLVVSLHSPHPPLDAPGEFATLYDPEKLILPAHVPASFKRESREIDHTLMRRMLANYLGKISLVDHCVSLLRDAFQQRGTWDGMMVVITSDHGEMMGGHGLLTKGRFFDDAVRVPLVVRWPGEVPPTRVKAPVQMMDAYPTMVAAAGGQVSPRRYAKSLLPLAKGEVKQVRETALSEIAGARAGESRMMVRDWRFKYWVDEKKEYLFDLESDPLEKNDLADEAAHTATLNEMRQKLLTHLRTTQVNYGEGYVPKVQRVRAEEEGKATKK